MPDFGTRLSAAVARCRNPVLVGLDPRWESLPSSLTVGRQAGRLEDHAQAYEEFCRGIIDVVRGLVPAIKPQAAFFEELGPPGMIALAETIRYARAAGLLVILDGKRNDIGSTAAAYARAYLGSPPRSAWGADALTVSPYLGGDSLEPFVARCRDEDSGIFILVKTSNPGGGLFQDLVADGRHLYEHVADYVAGLAAATVTRPGDLSCVGAVVGATYPAQLAALRQRMPHCWLLVPGYGAQGGAAADVAGAFHSHGLGALINNSRGIIFAYEKGIWRERYGAARWQDAVEAATRDMIDQLRAQTPAGQLA
ncbi:MAG: orotidine-5'-phosphate decarboxylase [Pirellulaceae bacterium]